MRLTVRPAEPADLRACEELVRDAFWDLYRPGCFEHLIWHRAMSGHPDLLRGQALVAEEEGRIAGCVLSTRARVVDGGSSIDVVGVGPLAVARENQGRGIGAELLRATLTAAAEAGERAAFLYGRPDYYARFGFRDAAEFGVTTPEGDNFPDFMARELRPGGLDGLRGWLEESDVLEVEPADVAAFDTSFPPR